MLDHSVTGVRDLAASKMFYERALAPLGLSVILEFPGVVGIGAQGKPEFWLREGGGRKAAHVAFRSRDRGIVVAFHEAALESGGRDNGGPGVREIYHPHYFGAFVLDPDDHNIEAVCHAPESS